MKFLKLNKSRSILQAAYSWYQKSGQLSQHDLACMEKQMLSLEASISAGDREGASATAEALQEFSKIHCKKSAIDYFKELLVAILVALLLAVVVRQMWFELYEIPTGSMRPTFREQDRVAVTKTPFGINLPLSTGHLLFDPSLVVRGGGITFTSEGVAGLDEDTLFMGIIPYKKRLIKRLIGKPGDSLYFYGGKIYGVDANGQPIRELIDATWMQKGQDFDLEHIPMITFSGELQPIDFNQVRFLQTGQPIGRLISDGKNQQAEIFDGKRWQKDDPQAQRSRHRSLKAYSDFFGMRNFAMARLLSAQELQKIHGINPSDLPEGLLYLELSHHPSLTYPSLKVFSNGIELGKLTSIIPLRQEHLDRLMENMYTARFVIRDHHAARYDAEGTRFNAYSPTFKDVPDGKYEFYRGKLEQVGWGAITYAAANENPLYSHTPQNVQKLFNMGIELSTTTMPSVNLHAPSRYAYFRNGDLYLLGGPIFKAGDTLLENFLAREEKREKNSSFDQPYTAFKDHGPPLTASGEYDVEFIKTFGITIPPKQYLVLGDNHAMSKDSRAFGFIPEANLQGAPSLILWPLGDRLGAPWQASYKLIELPRLIIWAIVAISTTVWLVLRRRYLRRPIILQQKMNRSEASSLGK